MSVIESNNYKVLISEDYAILQSFIDQLKASSIFVIVDENTKEHCLPILQESLRVNFSSIQISSGEKFKNLNTCSQIWKALMDYGCDRQSLVINLGGGVIGDMGGFIASTFMRGIRFIQMPTTLLSQVDASVGGKLGIDFLSYKNMIGVFQDPQMVWIDPRFLNTLDERELKSGFAEVIKHALISSNAHWESIYYFESEWNQLDWGPIIEASVKIKNHIVGEDPFEKGKRKILNFGHTIGHAVESHYLNSNDPLLHGEAIAIGMICEAHLSYQNALLSHEDLKQISSFIHRIFNRQVKLTDKRDELIALMTKDKKNYNEKIMFSVIPNIGECLYNKEFTKEQIFKSFEYYENSNN